MRPFPRLSVADNVVIGAYVHAANDDDARRFATDAITRVGLLDIADRIASELTTKELRLMELARALAGRPHILLLDETLAGLGSGEVAEVVSVLRALAGEGITIVIIEHTMHAMVRLVDRFLVLDHGATLIEGSPEAVTRDARVIEAYLGTQMERACSKLTTSPRAIPRSRSSSAFRFRVAKGEFVSVVGPNGAGKTTLFKTISGVVKPTSGSIRFDGIDLLKVAPSRSPHLGIAHVPEGRHVFPSLTVMENLELGAYTEAGRRTWKTNRDQIFDLFPVLAEAQPAIGRYAVRRRAANARHRPRTSLGAALLMLDEPSMGLAPASRISSSSG